MAAGVGACAFQGAPYRKSQCLQACTSHRRSAVHCKGRPLKRALVLSSSSLGAEPPDSLESLPYSLANQDSGRNSERLIKELFFAIAGLDRGAAADQASRMKVDDFVAQIEKIQSMYTYLYTFGFDVLFIF